VVFVCYSLTGC